MSDLLVTRMKPSSSSRGRFREETGVVGGVAISCGFRQQTCHSERDSGLVRLKPFKPVGSQTEEGEEITVGKVVLVFYVGCVCCNLHKKRKKKSKNSCVCIYTGGISSKKKRKKKAKKQR